MKRTGKFYRKNESEVMKNLGLNPTKNSGSGWVEKEDGENEKIIAQLKSTDAESMKINLIDIKKLFYHASVSHKVGLFIIQFLSSNDTLLVMRPEDIQEVAELIANNNLNNYKVIDKVSQEASSYNQDNNKKKIQSKIKTGSKKSRNNFYKQREENFNGKRKN